MSMNQYIKPGTHGRSGTFMPGGKWHNMYGGLIATCSLGVFVWVPKAGGNGVKKGRVKVRVKGPVSMAKEIEEAAAIIACELDNGEYEGPKTVTVNSSFFRPEMSK